MAAEIALKTFKIAGAGMIDVQILLREQVDCNCRFVLLPQEIQQDEELSVMDADLGDSPRQIGAALLIRQEDNRLRRPR